MRSRLYASSFADHSSFSNFHATGSVRRIDELSRIFYDVRLSDLVSKEATPNLLVTFWCSRSARLEYPRNDPLQKEIVLSILGYLRPSCMSSCQLVLHIIASAMHKKGPCSMCSKHLLYWCFSFQHLGLRLER